MKTLRDAIEAGKIVLDGAMGTQLMARNVTGNNELWGAEHPDELAEIHRAYIDAGANVILTNTFGGSRLKLAKVRLGERVAELNRRLAEIAVKAAGNDAYVLGDVGPTGEFLEPMGTMTEDEMTDVYREQIRALVEGGVHGIMVETMMDPNEAACAVRASKDVAPDLLVFASMTFERNPYGFRTMMGTTPELAAETLANAGADVIGANCGGITPDQFVDLLRELRVGTDHPLLVEPNAGLPELEDGKTVFREAPDTFARLTPKFRELGAAAVGGCCGTTPEHIRAIAGV